MTDAGTRSAPSPETGPCGPGGPGAPPRMLLLEDNAANVLVLECYLDELGLPPPVHARTIAEAYGHRTRIMDGAYDLVFCDAILPDGESDGFVRKVIADGFERLVLYTARSAAHEIAAFRRLGVRHVLPKPLQFRDFARLIDGMGIARRGAEGGTGIRAAAHDGRGAVERT